MVLDTEVHFKAEVCKKLTSAAEVWPEETDPRAMNPQQDPGLDWEPDW